MPEIEGPTTVIGNPVEPLRVAALTIATVSFALSLTTTALTTTLAAITISSRPVMRNGRDARACPRHMRAPARPPALRTHSTHPACAPRHFLALTLGDHKLIFR